MQARLTIKTIFKIDSLTTRYRLPAFTADDHLFARTLDGTIAPQLIAAADTPSRSSDGQLRVFSMSLQDREIAVIIIVRICRKFTIQPLTPTQTRNKLRQADFDTNALESKQKPSTPELKNNLK